MAALPPAPGMAPAPGWRWKPVLLGCAALLGLFALVLVGLGLYGLYWFVTPGRQSPTSVVIGPESVGAIRLNRAASDPGVQALFKKVMTELQRAGRSGRKLPDWLEAFQSWQAGQQSQNMVLWMPSEGTLALEQGPEDERGEPVVALNFRRFIRPMAYLFEHLAKQDPKTRVRRHAGREVITFPRGGGLCFAGGTLLFAYRAEALLPVLERLGQPPSAPPLLRELQQDSERWDLTGSLPRPQEAAVLMGIVLHAGRPEPGDEPDEDESEGEEAPQRDGAALLAVESARFGLDVLSADELHGQLRASYADVKAAQAAMLALEGPLLRLQRKAIAANLRLNLSRQASDRQVLVELKLGGLEAALTRWIGDAATRRDDGDAGAS